MKEPKPIPKWTHPIDLLRPNAVCFDFGACWIYSFLFSTVFFLFRIRFALLSSGLIFFSSFWHDGLESFKSFNFEFNLWLALKCWLKWYVTSLKRFSLLKKKKTLKCWKSMQKQQMNGDDYHNFTLVPLIPINFKSTSVGVDWENGWRSTISGFHNFRFCWSVSCRIGRSKWKINDCCGEIAVLFTFCSCYSIQIG